MKATPVAEVAHIAEHHGLHVDRSAPRNAVQAAISDRAPVHPRAEHGADGAPQLRVRVLRERRAALLFDALPEARRHPEVQRPPHYRVTQEAEQLTCAHNGIAELRASRGRSCATVLALLFGLETSLSNRPLPPTTNPLPRRSHLRMCFVLLHIPYTRTALERTLGPLRRDLARRTLRICSLYASCPA